MCDVVGELLLPGNRSSDCCPFLSPAYQNSCHHAYEQLLCEPSAAVCWRWNNYFPGTGGCQRLWTACLSAALLATMNKCCADECAGWRGPGQGVSRGNQMMLTQLLAEMNTGNVNHLRFTTLIFSSTYFWRPFTLVAKAKLTWHVVLRRLEVRSKVYEPLNSTKGELLIYPSLSLGRNVSWSCTFTEYK